MRILHCSDVHLRAETLSDQREIVDAFLDHVRAQQAVEPFDLVVFTGDLTYSGKVEQFELAVNEFLVPLLDAAALDKSRLLIVPGNHDIDRDAIDEIGERGLRETLNDVDAVNKLLDNDKRTKAHTERLDAYRSFHEKFFGEPLLLERVQTYDIGNVRVGIAGLNSAWRATGAENDGDKRHLLIGDRQVASALAAIAQCDFKIALMHHPLEWLHKSDHDRVEVSIEMACSLVLSGHLHKGNPREVHNVRGTTCYVAAGCLYESTDYFNGYNIVAVDPDGKVSVAMQTWWPDRRAFDVATNIAPHGEFSAQIAYGHADGGLTGVVMSAAAAPVGFNEAIAPIVDLARTATVVEDLRERPNIATISELLVRPVFLDLPYQQAVAVATEEGRRSLQRYDVAAVLRVHRRLTVVGGHESGLTSSLYWLLEDCVRRSAIHRPVYIDFHELGAGHEPVERAVRAALRLTHGAQRPPCVIAIDNLSVRKARVVERVWRHAVEHPDDILIFGVRSDNVTEWEKLQGDSRSLFHRGGVRVGCGRCAPGRVGG